jgi:hypothetical protein
LLGKKEGTKDFQENHKKKEKTQREKQTDHCNLVHMIVGSKFGSTRAQITFVGIWFIEEKENRHGEFDQRVALELHAIVVTSIQSIWRRNGLPQQLEVNR